MVGSVSRSGRFSRTVKREADLIRLTRFIATGVTVPGLFVRAAYWPEKWDWVNNVLMYWLVGAFYCLDIAYGMCLWYFRRLERMSSRVKQG